MNEKISQYVEDVKQYLVSKDDRDDILREIESHILDKVENKFGKITDEGIAEVIKELGEPARFASNYYQGEEIIAPYFGRILFLYTGILFAIHLGLSFIANILDRDIMVFPIFYAVSTNLLGFIFSLPLTFVFDFGLVCLGLMLITKNKKEYVIMHIGRFIKGAGVEVQNARILGLLGKFAASAILYFFAFKIDIIKPWIKIPEMDMNIFSIIQQYFTILFIITIIDAAAYIFKFLNNSQVIDVVIPGLQLIGLLIYHKMIRFYNIVGFDSGDTGRINSTAFYIVFTLLVIVVTVSFVKNLIKCFVVKYSK